MPSPIDVFTIREIARAAGVRAGQVRAWAEAADITVFRGFVRQADAVALVRDLSSPVSRSVRNRTLFGFYGRTQRNLVSLFGSGVLHALLLAALGLLASLGLLNSHDTDERVLPRPAPVRLVFLQSPGPGGGGGGGGSVALPVRPVVPPALSVVVPRPMDRPAISRVEVARREPVVMEPPPPLPFVQAPIASPPNSTVSAAGLPSAAPASAEPSQGPGAGGGGGSGAGAGLGSGHGSGVGPGSGAGAGGGVFQPGSGLEAPVLLREVRPLYTDDARKRAIEGNVVLEVVVRQDGTVGSLRVTRGLGAGLDQKATEAVRQWRFGPARRQGVAVDVVVEVSVEFKLR
jgi:TonB family protein